MKHLKLLIGSTALLGFVMSGTAFAGQASISGGQLQVQSSKSMSNKTLTVSGPNGYSATSFSTSGSPSASMSKNGAMADGLYKWQLTGSTSEMVPSSKSGMNNGRGDAERAMVNKSTSESGTFRVLNGSVVMPTDEAEAPPQRLPGGINEH